MLSFVPPELLPRWSTTATRPTTSRFLRAEAEPLRQARLACLGELVSETGEDHCPVGGIGRFPRSPHTWIPVVSRPIADYDGVLPGRGRLAIKPITEAPSSPVAGKNLPNELERPGPEPGTGFPIPKRVFVAIDDNPDEARDELLRWFTDASQKPWVAETHGFYGTPDQAAEYIDELVSYGASHILLNPIARLTNRSRSWPASPGIRRSPSPRTLTALDPAIPWLSLRA